MLNSLTKIPTIGIGAGGHCDGQVLVLSELLGMNSSFQPKFSKQFLNLEKSIINGLNQFDGEIKSKEFPTKEHSF